MRPALDAWNVWSNAWSNLVATMAWQAMLLALVVALVTWRLRSASPSVRYWLWQLVPLKLLAIPVWSLALVLPGPIVQTPDAQTPDMQTIANTVPEPALTEAEVTDPVVSEAVVAVVPSAEEAVPETRAGSQVGTAEPPRAAVPMPLTEARSWSLSRLTWRGWLMLGWALGVGFQLVRLVVQRWRLAVFLRRATLAGPELMDAVGKVAERLELRRAPCVLLTERDLSPFVCGIVRPKLVLPGHLPSTLDAAELQQLLAHELAHLKRRDLAWGWIAELARLVYFFHPVAHLAVARVRLERELACDQMAMALSGRGPAEYAETLVRIVSLASEPAIFRTSAAVGLDGNEAGAEKGSG